MYCIVITKKHTNKMIVANKSCHCHCCHCDDCSPCVVIIIVADDVVVVVSSFETLADLFNTYFRDEKRRDRERKRDILLAIHDQSGESTNCQKQRWSYWVEPPVNKNDKVYIKPLNPTKHLLMCSMLKNSSSLSSRSPALRGSSTLLDYPGLLL